MALGGIQGFQIGEIFGNKFHILQRQLGHRQIFCIIAVLSAMEGYHPQNLAVRQLCAKFFVIGKGNILACQIQALSSNLIGIALHKNVVVPIPDKAHRTGNSQCQHQGNHHQHGHKYFLHSSVLQVLTFFAS